MDEDLITDDLKAAYRLDDEQGIAAETDPPEGSRPEETGRFAPVPEPVLCHALTAHSMGRAVERRTSHRLR